ncbi:ewing's tumor-associated antigen 1 homolog [Notolabrus celidotus]|uniref:ewing's tumor-associated antigen 1 homolog n=1 Tax=Notolabrus celidotus TaxID=1203425 RepID=UPI00149040DB|nr:ewing's tumor-associated antigen 1 homolog [Notolabrus celidotus]
MSEPPAGTSEFSELWRSVSKLCHSKTQEMKTGTRMPADKQSPLRKDLQSPQRKGYSKFPILNNGDSPGDVEPTQDIFWDPTSPTPANTGPRNNRVVEISDIVNRIAPKDVKRKGTDSPLLQWIGDSAVPCTPDVPKPRMRKRSSRQSSVEDLMKLARQFDKNMQQDRETSERFNAVNNNMNVSVNTSKAKMTETSFSTNVKDSKCLSSSDQVEAELHALFDCSTQKVSGRLSQGSSASACSQEVTGKQLVTSTLAEPRQSEAKSSDKPDPAAQPTGVSDAFDDDWENDDLLNDSFVLAITQNPDKLLDTSPKTTLKSNTKTNTTQFTSVCNSTEATHSGHQPPNVYSKPSYSALQELCPKPKTTNRSTFKLEPNPHFQPKMAAKEDSKSNFTAIQSKSKMSNKNSAASKAPTIPQPTNDLKTCPVTSSVKDISDSLWDDRDDDALLFQICDNVEKISNSQPPQGSQSIRQEKQDTSLDGQRKTTAPLPIHTTCTTNTGARAYKKSPGSFVRSNSLPGTSCQAGNYQGWNVPMKGVNSKSGMSQSVPGSRMSLGTFSNSGNVNQDMTPRTVTARETQNSRSCHTAFKRNVSDSAVIRSKVFITSQMTGKCSDAEIERKKQDALARRRQRMQSTQKP